MEVSKTDLEELKDAWYSYVEDGRFLTINNLLKDGKVNRTGICHTPEINYETLLYCVNNIGIKE